MAQITTFSLAMPLHLGFTNCFLVENEGNHLLIDTGSSNRQTELERRLDEAGCSQGKLKLIILTHGDFDHTGNATYFRKKFNTQIAMHGNDAAMAERGDMFANRKQPNPIIRKLLPLLSGFGKHKWFKPDLLVDDGYDLSGHGFDAKILSLPGHSKGSIGILLASGELFCGDLLENIKQPSLNSIMDEPETANKSIERLKSQPITTVYPGHGKPFLFEDFATSN
jgi:hydroxyacylglutathione hydrolase